MSGYNRSPYAFDDLREIFQKAIDSPRGVKIVCKSRSEAITTRSRMNYLRKLDRVANADTYGKDHPLHMRSLWDKFVLRLPPRGEQEDTTIFVEKRSADSLVIELIEAGEDEILEEKEVVT